MRRLILMLVIITLTFASLAIIPQHTSAQTQPDSCALLQAEADAILAKAEQATGDEARALKERAAIFSTPCTDTISGEDMVELWGYDAAVKNELQRWTRYGLHAETAKVVGTGDDAAFQLAVPDPNKFNAPLSLRGVEVNNLLSYSYEGQAYPVYAVSMGDGTFRALPLIKKGRQTSQFLDPVSGEFIEWAGNWRRLTPIVTPNVAMEFAFRVRLDTPTSVLRAYIGDFTSVFTQLAVEIGQKDFMLQTPREKVNLAGSFDVGTWYSVRMRVTSNQMQVYVDDKLVGESKLDNFMFQQMLPGFETSAAPATVSLDDIQAKSNQQNK